ncbi:MAG: M20/M25/M40 family metallo-hydrolase [Clostridia bacterium]|nr:M20/M25/M40 family metallo-hydrolase [Clostridia bacterium]
MNKNFLYKLLNARGVSGSETPVEKIVYEYVQQFADKVDVDVMGSVTATINPEVPFKVMLAGHADEIGLRVTHIEDNGLIRVSRVGGIYATAFPGHKVVIDTAKGPVYGAVLTDRQLVTDGNMGADKLRIDIGAKTGDEAREYVSIGDPATFDTNYRELLGDRMTARAFDDRIGVFVVMEALRLAKEQGAVIGVSASATVGEEVGAFGAFFAASAVKPAIGIAVDVTYATDTPFTDPAAAGNVVLGGGPVLCKGPGIPNTVNECIEASADALDIKLQYEVSGGRTHTDGDSITRTNSGVPFTVLSIPLRYMHSPAEVLSLSDVEKTVELLAGFLCDCSANMNLKPFG